MVFKDREHFEEVLTKAVESDLEKAVSGWRTRHYVGRQTQNIKMREPTVGGPTKVTHADGRMEIIEPKESKESKEPKEKKKNTKAATKPINPPSTDKKVVIRRAKNNTEND